MSKIVTEGQVKAVWPGLKDWWNMTPEQIKARQDAVDADPEVQRMREVGMDGWGMTAADRAERAKGRG